AARGAVRAAPGFRDRALARNAAKADVPGRAVDRLALPRRRAVAQAVVGRAEVRAALHDAAREAVVPGGSTAPSGAGHGLEPVVRPLPDVAGHVVEAVAVRRIGLDRRGALVAVEQQVLPGELALPGIGHHAALRRELLAPREGRAVQATAGRVLPLGLARQRLAGP